MATIYKISLHSPKGEKLVMQAISLAAARAIADALIDKYGRAAVQISEYGETAFNSGDVKKALTWADAWMHSNLGHIKIKGEE